MEWPSQPPDGDVRKYLEGAETLCCSVTAPQTDLEQIFVEEWAEISSVVCANPGKNYRKRLISGTVKIGFCTKSVHSSPLMAEGTKEFLYTIFLAQGSLYLCPDGNSSK